MLQRVLATLLCLLGATAIGLGVASATVWRSPDTLVASATAADGTTLLMTEPGVLDMGADEVTVRATTDSGEPVVLALGRTADVEAWIGADPHTRVTGLEDRETLSTREVAGGEADAGEEPAADEAAADEVPGEVADETPAAETPAPEPADETPAEETPAEEPADEAPAEEPAEGAEVPSPAGSDLWLEEVTGEGEATLPWQSQDGRYSVLAASTGAGAGPVTLTMTWPQVVATPWLVPAVAAGSVLLLAGLLWWTVLVVRGRRAAHAPEAAAHPDHRDEEGQPR